MNLLFTMGRFLLKSRSKILVFNKSSHGTMGLCKHGGSQRAAIQTSEPNHKYLLGRSFMTLNGHQVNGCKLRTSCIPIRGTPCLTSNFCCYRFGQSPDINQRRWGWQYICLVVIWRLSVLKIPSRFLNLQLTFCIQSYFPWTFVSGGIFGTTLHR